MSDTIKNETWAERFKEIYEEDKTISKDELFEKVFEEGLRGLSKFTTILKLSGITFGSTSTGWRQKTVDMFIERQVEIDDKKSEVVDQIDLDAWSKEMIMGDHLWVPKAFKDSKDEVKIKEGIKNYKQLFPLFVAMWNRESF